jgi:hypothetical protein
VNRTIRGFLLISGLLSFHALPAAQSGDKRTAEAARLIQKEAAGHRLILIGELHGTRQVPELVARLVSEYSVHEPVLLGLEVPTSERPLIASFLASNGNPKARSVLQAGAFWRIEGVQHDGRRNFAVLDLIDKVRQLKASGRNVDILPYDNPPTRVVDSEQRDKAMANRLRDAFAGMPRGRLVVVSGNVHAMLERPDNAPAEMQDPMGSYLRDLDPYSVDVTARAGESWACLQKCGPIPLHAPSLTSRRLDGGPYDLLIALPRLTLARLIGGPSKKRDSTR